MSLDLRALPFEILYVDADAAAAARFREILGEQFSVTTADCGTQALRQLQLALGHGHGHGHRHEIAVMVAEQALPDMTASELFEQARTLRPDIARLLTATELRADVAEAAINRGRVSGYMAKPWQPEKLRGWLVATLDALRRDTSANSLDMSLWHGGQVAAATTIYEEMVHELSNPLGALEINASLVADLLREVAQDGLDGAALRESLQTASEAHTDSLAAIEQMKTLISRMRHGGRPRARAAAAAGGAGAEASNGHAQCDPARVIEATVRVVRAEVEKVAQLEVGVAAALTVQMEASVLGQIILNLLLNAAQAVPADRRSENRIEVVVSPAGPYCAISVQDNGPGIADGLIDRVFEPFFTTKESGTGLGLAICRELVTRAHGTITVENPREGGARFDIRVPVGK